MKRQILEWVKVVDRVRAKLSYDCGNNIPMSDSFRKLCDLTKPDPRSEMWLVTDPNTGQFRSKKIEDLYSQIEKLVLHEGVPEKVRTHFETTRNLFLYSWFVWRFRAVAEWHSCATLELALKIKTKGKIKYLPKLIDYAIENGLVKNEGFSVWQSARERFEQNKITMKEFLRQMVLESKQSLDEEFNYDYMGILKESIRYIRNEYAHGSSKLGLGQYLSLQIVSEFINQLFMDNKGI
jgi:hypothetical protein